MKHSFISPRVAPAQDLHMICQRYAADTGCLNFSSYKHARSLIYIAFERQDPKVPLKYKYICVQYQRVEI